MILQVLFNGIVAASIYSLVGLSFALIYIPTRFFHFAHGATLVWGAYLCYAGHVLLGLPLWLAAPLAILLTSILGMAIELGVYGPARRRGASSTALLVISLGLYIVLQNVVSLLFGDYAKTLRAGTRAAVVSFYRASLTQVQVTVAGAAIGVLFLTWTLLRFTEFGLSIRATASDPDLALTVGVDRNRIILLTFALGSAIGGAAGILISLDVDLTPTMGLNLLMMGVVAVVVGGSGSVPGVVLGALLLGMTQHFGVWKIGTEWQDGIAFLILIVFLICRPHGFLGKLLRTEGP